MEEKEVSKKKPNNGRIELIIGPMFSGKSSELFRRLRNLRYAKKTVKLFKYSGDTRYNKDNRNELAHSHDGVTMPAEPVDTLAHVNLDEEADVIGIDEGQFIDGLESVSKYFASIGKIVIIAGLDSDYRKRPFERITRLVAQAERVTKLQAVCMSCYAPASFSKRISPPASDGEDVVEDIGGADKYIAVCRSCH
jgi:thymidine kinase